MVTIITSPAATPVGLLIVKVVEVAVAVVVLPRWAMAAWALPAPRIKARRARRESLANELIVFIDEKKLRKQKAEIEIRS